MKRNIIIGTTVIIVLLVGYFAVKGGKNKDASEILISVENGIGTASARSIEGFPLNEALGHCAETLEEFGGHKQAAGLTIKEENIDVFKKKINEFALDLLEIRDLIPTFDIDCEVSLGCLGLDLLDKIEQLEPYGEGNSAPIFCSRQLTVRSNPAVLGKNTLKFWVTDGDANVSVVGFGMGDKSEFINVGQKVDLAYQLIIDDWNKAPTIQLKLKDIKSSE